MADPPSGTLGSNHGAIFLICSSSVIITYLEPRITVMGARLASIKMSIVWHRRIGLFDVDSTTLIVQL